MANLSWQEALDEFIQAVRKSYQQEIDSIFLFGSQARGEAQEGSDIDLLLVINDSVEIAELERKIDAIASEISLKFNVVISLVHMQKSRFEQRTEPLLINIRKEGKKIA